MDNIFGLEMSLLLVVMLTLLAVSFVTVLYIFLRNRIMFFIGVRNIPRRVAQTVLVILGLMLSTLIISAAFTTGDTVDHSITLEIRQTLGHVDELIEFESDGDRPTSGLHIPQSEFDALAEEVADDDNIDGIAPGLVEEVTAATQAKALPQPNSSAWTRHPSMPSQTSKPLTATRSTCSSSLMARSSSMKVWRTSWIPKQAMRSRSSTTTQSTSYVSPLSPRTVGSRVRSRRTLRDS
jgi:hypothetical protein